MQPNYILKKTIKTMYKPAKEVIVVHAIKNSPTSQVVLVPTP